MSFYTMNCALRPIIIVALAGIFSGLLSLPACAQSMPSGKGSDATKTVDVSADQSLEWYQDKHLYIARGKAKAIRGDMVVDADVLMAHEREKPEAGTKPQIKADKTQSGDIDKLTAEGNVHITNPRQRVTGDRAIDDFDQHIIVVTGNNLRYETEKETVTAKDSLEYWEEKKIAVARGNAVADKGDRHVEGDTLTAEFRDTPAGGQELTKMTALGHVVVITKGDVVRGNQAVYDISGDIAIVTGSVHITRKDGTQLTGDVAETNFKSGQSRLMNSVKGGRVRALLTSHQSDKAPQK